MDNDVSFIYLLFDGAFITETDIWQSGRAAVRMKEKFSVAMETATGEVKSIKAWNVKEVHTHSHTEGDRFWPHSKHPDFNGEQICNGEESLQGQSGFLLWETMKKECNRDIEQANHLSLITPDRVLWLDTLAGWC